MAYLYHLQTVIEGELPEMGEALRLDYDSALNVLLVHDAANLALIRIWLGSGSIERRFIGLDDRAQENDVIAIDVRGDSRTLDRATLERLAINPGDSEAYFDGTTFYGNLVTLASMEQGGARFLYAARKAGSGIEVYRLSETGVPTPLQNFDDTQFSHARTVTAMTAFQSAGQSWLATVSSSENGISLFRIGPDGLITIQGSFGFPDLLPATTPTALASVDLAGRSYLLMSAFGSSSLTVLEVSDGRLIFRDQVNDSLDTRFSGASELATFTRGNMTLIAVSGIDDGVTLFQLLPGGRLIHRETIVDQVGMALADVSSLKFVEFSDGTVDLFVLSARDGGLSRFRLDETALGVAALGLVGTSGNDVLTASGTGAHLQGGAGSDVLIDGSGQDTFTGGTGADVFIFAPDGRPDLIRDFDPTQDRLDFSAFDAVHDISALRYRVLSNGAELGFGQDLLTIWSASGRSLSLSELAAALDTTSDHVLIPAPLPRFGTAGNDLFEASRQADTIDGGNGFDTLSYQFAASEVVVNLGNSASNTGAALGHVLTSIEGIIGSAFDDYLSGDAGANLLNGVEGDDTILGGEGADWITPGSGNDLVDGGPGWDMVSFVDLEDTPGRTNTDYRLDINLSTDRATNHTGSEITIIANIERVTGTIFADRIRGDGASNELRGLGDYDWFVGTWGSDTYDGGTGQDMVSYVEATSGITVDLALGQGTRGLAAGDQYTSIERITGSSYADLFFGDANSNDFRGLGGYDTFVGSAGGRERYDGGSGFDTVTYYLSASGVEASLLRGYGSRGDAARDLYTSIENLSGTSFDDILTGDHGRNQLRGLGGDDLIFGNGGTDYITGGRGNDTIDGGSGSDYAIFSGLRSSYTVTENGDAVIVTGPDGVDVMTDVEYFRFDDIDVDIWSL